MFQIGRLLAVFTLCMATQAPAIAALAWCDLNVQIRGEKGEPIEAPVVIKDAQARIVATSEARGGIAKFCDLGLGTFSITIGGETCGQVIVRLIEIYPQADLVVPVTYKPCHGMRVWMGCTALVRVVGADREPIIGAKIHVVDSAYERTTDDLGRAVVSFASSYSVEVAIQKDGWSPATAALSCPVNKRHIERQVVLTRK